jgi:hypothetical protein
MAPTETAIPTRSLDGKFLGGALPIAIFGIDNSGVGVFANLLVIFLVAIWLALVFWTYSDARRRLQDTVLIGSATLAALIFPFAGTLVYVILRPPETLDDAYERELDVRAAELRVRLLESAVKGGPGSSAHAATVAGEISGEPAARRSSPPPSGSRSGAPSSGQKSPSSSQPSSRRSPEPAPQRSGQPVRRTGAEASGEPSRRPPAAGADKA